MPDYASTIVPFAGAALLAALTGTLRRYGAHLERLSDLAEKMPEGSPARNRLDLAVQTEAERLLAVPRKVRVSNRILIVYSFLLLTGLLANLSAFRITDPRFASLTAISLLVAFVLGALSWVSANYYLPLLLERLLARRRHGSA